MDARWLLLAHPLAWVVFHYHPRWWITRDVRAFVADGASSSLRRVWHRQRFTWRVAITVLVAAIASLHAASAVAPFLVSMAGLLALGAGLWVYAFNPGLNTARTLAYVPRYYVSYAAGAAYFPDGWLWARAYRQVYPGQSVVHFPDPAVGEVAGHLLRRLLAWSLGAGVGLYLLSVVALYLLLRSA